jgi:O-acetyl-ADP-ribose deacetylase (regulator of RNase III)
VVEIRRDWYFEAGDAVMIDLKTGDILQADVEALVNTVNCVGIMGRGIALQFKQAFPENFKAYAAACARDEVQPGRMFVFETGFLANPKYVINFPTKRHWRDKSRIGDIDAGLKALVDEIRKRGIRSIAVPPLGSGLGGLHWAEVRPLIEAALGNLDLQAVVFEPHASADPRPVKRVAKIPKMTEGEEGLDRGRVIPAG